MQTPYSKAHKAFVLMLTLLTAAFIQGCNSNFDLDLTSDNHPLLDVSDTYTQTKYPVVFVHGLYGFDDIFGLDYWYQIPEVLENGGTEVYVAEVSGANSPQVRGEQLITELERLYLETGHQRYHLVGHSLGGPTIRYAASERPDLVISATSVSGANHGSEAANNESLEVPAIRVIINIMGNLLGHVIDLVSQNSFEQNIIAATEALDKEGIAQFNSTYPAGIPTVYCNGAEGNTNSFSHGSNSDYVENNPINSFDDFAQYYDASNDPSGNAEGPYTISYDSDGDLIDEDYELYFYSFGGILAETNSRDPLDSLHRAVNETITADVQTDGMVERCSTHHGYVVKDNLYMNHLDFMNWFLGLRDERAPYPPSLYRAHVHYLQQLEINEGL